MADGTPTPASKPYYEVDWTKPTVLVVGSEAEGIRAEWKPLLEQGQVIGGRIPLRNGVESLNAAVAGSMILSEALRQREAAASKEGKIS